MADHWYVMKNGHARRYEPLKKDGTPYLRIPAKQAAIDEAVKSVSHYCKMVDESGWMPHYFTKHGVKAGLGTALSVTLPAGLLDEPDGLEKAVESMTKQAMDICNIATEADALRGQEFHDAIADATPLMLIGSEIPDGGDPLIHRALHQVGTILRGLDIKEVRQEHCVYLPPASDRVGYGGTADLLSRNIVLDYKTVKDYREPRIKELVQLVAYKRAAVDMGLVATDAKLVNIYISRLTGEVGGVWVWTPRNEAHGSTLLEGILSMAKTMERVEESIRQRSQDKEVA